MWAVALFRSACCFALNAPPSGLRRASRQAERKKQAEHPEPAFNLREQRRKREKATHRINNLGGAKSDDQKGPNQVDKTIPLCCEANCYRQHDFVLEVGPFTGL